MKHDSRVVAASPEPSAFDRIDKIAAGLQGTIKRSRGADAVRRTEAAKDLLTALAELDEARRKLKEELPTLEKAATMEFMSLASSLADVCAKRSWRIEGTWPNYIVERGVAIDVDESKRTATVGGKRVAATARTVEEALEPQVATLVPRGFDPTAFIASLAAAYDELCQGRLNAEIRVLELYRSLVTRAQSQRFWRDAAAERFTPLGHDQFRARLSLAVELTAGRAPDGRVLHVLPPLDPNDAIFMYLTGECRFAYVGRVAFTAEGPR